MALENQLDARPIELADLLQLVEHRESVQSTETVESVYNWFQKHQQEYIGVLNGNRFVGLVSRGQVGFLLGARFGIAIYGRQPIGSHLIEKSLFVSSSAPLLTLLEAALSRSGDLFYDDVALVDQTGAYLGIMTVPTLVRWQSRLILEKTARPKLTSARSKKIINIYSGASTNCANRAGVTKSSLKTALLV